MKELHRETVCMCVCLQVMAVVVFGSSKTVTLEISETGEVTLQEGAETECVIVGAGFPILGR